MADDQKTNETTEKTTTEPAAANTSDGGSVSEAKADSSEVNEPKTKELVEASKTETQEEKNTDNG